MSTGVVLMHGRSTSTSGCRNRFRPRPLLRYPLLPGGLRQPSPTVIGRSVVVAVSVREVHRPLHCSSLHTRITRTNASSCQRRRQGNEAEVAAVAAAFPPPRRRIWTWKHHRCLESPLKSPAGWERRACGGWLTQWTQDGRRWRVRRLRMRSREGHRA